MVHETAFFLQNRAVSSWHENSIMHALMEIIAITVWNEIMSPLFDASCHLLFVRPGEDRELRDVRHMSIIEKAETIKMKGARHLLCGAISKEAFSLLSEREITVLSWISGPVANIIDSYKRQEDVRKLFAMPGYGSGSVICRHKHQRGNCCRIK
jgi:hypothetical protein